MDYLIEIMNIHTKQKMKIEVDKEELEAIKENRDLIIINYREIKEALA